MKEFGIDISKQKSKIITEDMIRNATVIVNTGCMDKQSCPTLSRSLVRDEIEQRVRQLAANLVKNSEQTRL